MRKKRKPNIAKTQSSQSFDPHSLIEEILSSAAYTLPSDTTIVHDIIVSLANYARSVDNELKRLRKAMMGDESSLTLGNPSSQLFGSSPSDTNMSGEDSSSDDDDVNEETFKKITLGHSNVRHFGKSSNMRFIHDIITNATKNNQPLDFTQHDLYLARFKRPEYWGLDMWKFQPEIAAPIYTFPEIDLLWDLLRIYFTEVAPYFPLLHRPTFEKAVINGRHLLDHSFGALLLAVCAVAARDSQDPRILKQDTKITAGWQWFSQIRLVRPNFVEPTSIHELQLYCVAYLYLRQTNMFDSAWSLVGLGLRLSLDRGIHRLKTNKSRDAESELWIRIFWILRNADVLQGLSLGRPAAIDSEHFDLDRPVECDDEYWEKTEHNEGFTQPPGKTSGLSFFTHYNKLVDIAASVQRSVYCVNEVPEYKDDSLTAVERNRKKAMQHDSALNHWLMSLPEHLRWDPNQPDKIRLNHSAILYTTFYWIQLQLHKNFLFRQASASDNQQGFPSFAICANAARSTVRISQVLHQRSKNRFEVLLNIAHCATFLNLILWRHRQGTGPTPYADIKVVRSDVTSIVEMLTNADPSAQTVGRVADKLKAFISARGLLSNVSVESAPTSKRMRRDDMDDMDDSSVELNFESQLNIPEIEQRRLAGTQRVASYMTNSQIMIDPSEVSVLSDFHFESAEGKSTSGFIGAQTPRSSFTSAIPASLATDPATLGAHEETLQIQTAHFTDTYASDKGSDASGSHESSVGSVDIDSMQHDWDSFMKNVDEVLLAIGLNQ
ncbi:hypothetical protein HHX47_DHR4000632 [Lentinula edodes]|nr:hypothetical protein HHX47_DHR4000632 [Lentinula edodes]